MITAVTRRPLEYHLPTGEQITLPAGTRLEVFEEGAHTPEQLRWLEQRAKKRRLDDAGNRIPLPEVVIVQLELHPDGWTSVPVDELQFPRVESAEEWG